MEGLLVRFGSVCMRDRSDDATCSLLHKNVPCWHEDKNGTHERHLQEITPYIEFGQEGVDRRGNCQPHVC